LSGTRAHQATGNNTKSMNTTSAPYSVRMRMARFFNTSMLLLPTVTAMVADADRCIFHIARGEHHRATIPNHST
jgi:hypothetical protein